MPEKYEGWLDAQIYSKQALESYANFKDIIHPLERTKDPSVLENMWKFIDLVCFGDFLKPLILIPHQNYKATSGVSIDSLWRLDEAHRRIPQWSAFYMPNLRIYESDSDDEQLSMPLSKSTGQKRSGGKKKPKKLLAITDGRADDDSNSSMPELQSVSDSSDENDEDIFVSENDEEEESDEEEDESDYDSEEEEVYRTMLREAMDTAMAIPDFFDPKSTVPEFDALAEERKGNPFLKLLGSLRGEMPADFSGVSCTDISAGRMFSSDPKLSSTTRTEPRKGFFGQKGQISKASAKQTTASARPIKTSDASRNKIPPTQPARGKERPPSAYKTLR